jgi:Flp pilus assembly protein TadD
VASYQRATQLDRANPEAWRGLAVAQFAAGMTGEALATFEKGLKQFPQDPLHYQEYAITLFKLAETGDENAEARALDLMRTAMTMDGSLSQPSYYLGNLALQRGRASEALQYLEAAARLDHTNSKIHYALSRAYRRLGRGEDAAKEQRLYQELKALEEKSGPGFSTVVKGK